jgi:hypothetical protein
MVLGVLSSGEAAHAADCAPGQETLFSCSTSARKAISVCGSADLTATSGLVQYRLRNRAKLELGYPPAGADWRQVTRAGTLMFSGGGGAYLSFSRPPYRYVVYTAVGRGWGSKAGVVVERNGKKTANLACQGEPQSELGPDLFSKAGIAADDAGFELP